MTRHPAIIVFTATLCLAFGVGWALGRLSPGTSASSAPGVFASELPSPPAARLPQTPLAPGRPAHRWALAFVRDTDIWIADRDGSGQRLVVRNGKAPCWSPDKRQIAFARDGNVWVANADGSGERQLTFRWGKMPPGVEEYERGIDISWSPNGKYITFSRVQIDIKGGVSGQYSDVSGYSIFDVTLHPAEEDELSAWFDWGDDYRFPSSNHPAWSRSGKQLAFVRNGDIWLAERGIQLGERDWERFGRTSGSWAWNWSRLAATASYDVGTHGASRWGSEPTHLSWSPDGRYLAYGRQRMHGSGVEWVELLAVGSGESRTLEVGALDPCFSPDGKWIAYYAYPTYFSDAGVWMISLDGRRKRRLVANAWQPAW